MIKVCKKCQVETGRNADGKCKLCMKARNAAYQAANKDRLKACSKAYCAANRDKATSRAAAWTAANPERSKAYKAAYRIANQAKIQAWYAANPESRRISQQNRQARKRENGGTLSKGLAVKLFKLQKGKCPCCSLPLGDNYHLDHIQPISLGGSNTDDNIQLLRQRCNNQKHTKHQIDFMQSRGFLL